MSFTTVDLPDPVEPMMAVVCPGSQAKSRFSSTHSFESPYLKLTSSNTMRAPPVRPASSASRAASGAGSQMVGCFSSTSFTRCAATSARGSMMEIMPIMRKLMMMTMA